MVPGSRHRLQRLPYTATCRQDACQRSSLWPTAAHAPAQVLYWLGNFDAEKTKFLLEGARGPLRLDLGDLLYAPNLLRDDRVRACYCQPTAKWRVMRQKMLSLPPCWARLALLLLQLCRVGVSHFRICVDHVRFPEHQAGKLRLCCMRCTTNLTRRLLFVQHVLWSVWHAGAALSWRHFISMRAA